MSRLHSLTDAPRTIKRGLMGITAFVCLTLLGTTGAAPLALIDAGGGSLSAPVAFGNYLYVGTGATIAIWDLHDPTDPRAIDQAGQIPAAGPVRALAMVGGYLYAAWNTPWDTGGIVVYALDDPAHPRVAALVDSFPGSATKRPEGLAVAGNTVYVGDADHGLIVLDASDPLAPVSVNVVDGIYECEAMAVYGDVLLTSGTSFIGDRLVRTIDISTRTAPVQTGMTSLEGFLVLRAVLADGYAIGVGDELIVQDLHDPQNITRIFEAPIDQATQAIRAGNVLYLFGTSGAQVWDFSLPSAPALLRTLAIDGFGADQAASTSFGPLLLTRTDRGLLLDATDPVNPTLAASFTLPFGVAANAADIDAAHVHVAEAAYGFGVFDATTLSVIGRYDADLPADMSARDMEDISVDGARAFLAAWGYGILIADLSDPAHPTPLGRFEFPFASSIEAHGNLVYAGSTTNGGIFKIIDVTDPAMPLELASLPTSSTIDLTVRGNYAYLADGGGGLRIIDVSIPAQAHMSGQYAGCGASGIDVSADGNTAYLSCDDGITIVDTHDKANPVLLGSLSLPGNDLFPDYNVAWCIVVAGSTAYVGTEFGVDEIDVTQPATPVKRYHHDTGYFVRKLARAPDGRLFAFAAEAGTYVFAPDSIFQNGFD